MWVQTAFTQTPVRNYNSDTNKRNSHSENSFFFVFGGDASKAGGSLEQGIGQLHKIIGIS